MFTGLVQQCGRVVRVERAGGAGALTIEAAAWPTPLEIGESIAVQGVCLTLTRQEGQHLRFDLLEETFRKTNLGEKGEGRKVNLERSLRVGDAIGGHFVTGHVDGTGVLEKLAPVGRDWIVHVRCSADLMAGMVPKGSVALDGTSLTLVDLHADGFTVHIIPHTYAVTSLSDLRPGDRMNIETDMLGKYVQRILTANKDGGLTWDKIRESGLR